MEERDPADWGPTQVMITVEPPPFEIKATRVKITCGETFYTVWAEDGGKFNVYRGDGRGYPASKIDKEPASLNEAVAIAKDLAYRAERGRLLRTALHAKTQRLGDPTLI